MRLPPHTAVRFQDRGNLWQLCLDGLAFFTSQISDRPSFFSAFSNSKFFFGRASACFLISAKGFSFIIFSYRVFVYSAISFKIVIML